MTAPPAARRAYHNALPPGLSGLASKHLLDQALDAADILHDYQCDGAQCSRWRNDPKHAEYYRDMARDALGGGSGAREAKLSTGQANWSFGRNANDDSRQRPDSQRHGKPKTRTPLSNPASAIPDRKFRATSRELGTAHRQRHPARYECQDLRFRLRGRRTALPEPQSRNRRLAVVNAPKGFLHWRCTARECPNYGGVLDRCPVLAGYAGRAS